MRKIMCLVFMLLFSINVYATDFSTDPNDFTEIVDTMWKFTIGFDFDDYIVIKFYSPLSQDKDGDLYLMTLGIDINLSNQIGITYYGDFSSASGQGFVCALSHPLGYTDWFEIYEFTIDGDSAIGTFRTYYGTWLGSAKWLTGSKIEDLTEDPDIPDNSTLPSIPDSIYNPDNKKDDDDKFGCFIFLLRPHLLPCR